MKTNEKTFVVTFSRSYEIPHDKVVKGIGKLIKRFKGKKLQAAKEEMAKIIAQQEFGGEFEFLDESAENFSIKISK